MGIILPHSKAAQSGIAEEAEDSGSGDAFEEVTNLGVARPRGETAEEKRQRKNAAKEAKAARRAEKKGTKVAFKEEKARQEDTLARTRSIKGTNLSR